MPRSGVNGTYTLPPNTDNQQPLTPISSSMFNSAMDDVEQTFNSVQPEAYGGTGADNFADARENMGLVTASVGAMDSQRNRIVNGDMSVSQENSNTAGTVNGYFGADQFATYRVNSAGTITTQRVASFTPAGSPYRYRVTITAADASLAAGEYLTITQPLEGSNVADFRYGSASAKASVLRFGFKGPAGTYAARLGNSANNRSFVALFTIAGGDANTDTVQTISIPGDTTGTWLTAEGVIGITLDIVLACGSTFQGSTGWQAGNRLGTSAVSNGMATAGAIFELFDVGIRLDPDATGVYGRYVVGERDPDYRSERYWFMEFAAVSGDAPASATVNFSAGYMLVKPAKSPTLTISDRTSEINIGTITPDYSGVAAVRFSISTSAAGYYRTRFAFTANARLS